MLCLGFSSEMFRQVVIVICTRRMVELRLRSIKAIYEKRTHRVCRQIPLYMTLTLRVHVNHMTIHRNAHVFV